ncbi:hypothetical protein [Rubellimicrobium arenae]|uniref:hypothetical protein n=1 Tax=Rubellimicrobium arenae TaxID=2817372 RepID=UPI001B317DC1|nr:hypothetical protein [Rubellimicrobium arenae]
MRDVVRAEQDAVFGSELWGLALAGATRAARAARLGQLPPEIVLHAFLRGDEAGDRLLAHTRLRAFEAHAPGDLLGRPTGLDPVDDPTLKLGVADQLALLAVPDRRRPHGRPPEGAHDLRLASMPVKNS